MIDKTMDSPSATVQVGVVTSTHSGNTQENRGDLMTHPEEGQS